LFDFSTNSPNKIVPSDWWLLRALSTGAHATAARSDDGTTALMVASVSGHVKTIKIILQLLLAPMQALQETKMGSQR
jgi:hypothetical protein